MSQYETLTLLGVLAGVVISVISLLRARRVDNQQRQLQAKQEELTDLQLQRLRRDVSQKSDSEKPAGADVRVTLEGSRGRERFLITNWGYGAARDVKVQIEPRSGHTSPLVQGDSDEKLPIPELLPGDTLSLLAALTFGTGTAFDATWSWTDPDGSRQQRQGRVAIP